MYLYDVFSDTERVETPLHVTREATPCVLELPHAGTCVPVDLMDKYIIDRRWLVDADLFTDDLYAYPASRVSTPLNRYVVNMNRQRLHEDDINGYKDEDALHNYLAGMELSLQGELTEDERERLLTVYDDYQDAVQERIEEAVQRHGDALLIAGHSMNATSGDNTPDSGERPDIALGTQDGDTASHGIISAMKNELEQNGYTVTRGEPYSGGPTIGQFSQEKNVHAVQVEVNKRLYMDEERLRTHDGFPALRRHLHEAIRAAVQAL